MTETQARQFCLKLKEPNAGKKRKLEQTLDRFKDCVNTWIAAIDELSEYPTRRNVHNYAYADIREEYSSLHASTIQECMNRAIGILRNHTGPLPHYSADSMSFRSGTVGYDEDNIGVPTVNKERVWLPLIIPEHFNGYHDLEKGQCQIQRREEGWYAVVAVEYPISRSYTPERTLGVDRGIRNLAVVSDTEGNINEFYSGKLLSRREELESRRVALAKEKAGDNNVWRAMQRLSGKEAQTTRQINHEVAKDIVQTADNHQCSLALEMLQGVREGERRQHVRKMLHRWPYQDFAHKINYKAETLGVPVHYVNPEGTSSTCSACGQRHTDVENEKMFKCRECDYELHRDLNAARNIAAKAPIQ